MEKALVTTSRTVEFGLVPMTILSGFLGAGKTSVLNRILGAEYRRRVAVVVNELGRIDIDGKLLKSRSGDVVELPGGCVCHEVRTQEELWQAIDELLDRRRVDRVVLETTGIAEPQAVIAGLAALPDDRRRVFDDGVVTVVDAQAGFEQLSKFSEARSQVEAADRILLSKMDVAGVADLPHLHALLSALNPSAERAALPAGEAATKSLAAWLLDRASGRVSYFPRGKVHAHQHTQLSVATFSDEAPLLAEPLLEFCKLLGPRLVRAKGFVHAYGERQRGFLERAGCNVTLAFGDPWPPGPRRSELVFIGEGIDPGAIQRHLCSLQLHAGTGGAGPLR
jgi:G3E family GTPase